MKPPCSIPHKQAMAVPSNLLMNFIRMKSYLTIVLLFVSLGAFSQAEDSASKAARYYPIILQDSPSKLFTMRQFNQNYLSGYRLMVRGLNSTIKNPKYVDLLQLGMQAFFLMPLTHEEGHRSILTAKGIGSISQPFFNSQGAAYVNGVTDITLQNLRDNDLPTYIRLHTAGLESDYMLTVREETIGSFEQDDFNNFKWEYLVRKMAIMQYYLIGLFKYDKDLKEEANELNRDIVGLDTYGAARHLFRPTMPFQRYTRYKELIGEEKRFINRAGYRSLLNLLNPLMVGRYNFKLNDNTRINAGMGYTMAPFGDFIDENVWIKHRNTNLHVYFRQFQNKSTWFPAFGVGLYDYKLTKSLRCDVVGHYWSQPKDFDFRTSRSFSGGAVDATLRYFLFSNLGAVQAISVDLGLMVKTKGYLPEEVDMEKGVGMRFGLSLYY